MNMRLSAWKVFTFIFIAAALLGQDIWKPGTLITPDRAAKQIRNSSGTPIVLFVGFPVLYRAAHIPDAIMAGPASTPDGIARLKKAVSQLPRDRKIILYCGCCPFVKCPNVRPAYRMLRDLGFAQVQVIELDQNFHTNWIERGFPVKKAS